MSDPLFNSDTSKAMALVERLGAKMNSKLLLAAGSLSVGQCVLSMSGSPMLGVAAAAIDVAVGLSIIRKHERVLVDVAEAHSAKTSGLANEDKGKSASFLERLSASGITTPGGLAASAVAATSFNALSRMQDAVGMSSYAMIAGMAGAATLALTTYRYMNNKASKVDDLLKSPSSIDMKDPFKEKEATIVLAQPAP